MQMFRFYPPAIKSAGFQISQDTGDTVFYLLRQFYGDKCSHGSLQTTDFRSQTTGFLVFFVFCLPSDFCPLSSDIWAYSKSINSRLAFLRTVSLVPFIRIFFTVTFLSEAKPRYTVPAATPLLLAGPANPTIAIPM